MRITTPLCSAVMNAGEASVPSSLNRGAVHTTSYTFHSPGFLIALTIGDRRQQTTLLAVFGALALLIASLGLYGLLAQTVSARGREIGIRMALGATWRSVMRMVMSRGIALTAVGVGIGAALAWSVTRAMASLLYGVGASDPVTFALVAGLLATVSAIACAIPAMRAARVDPMLVLRDH